jgi:hypothetical protein
MVSKGQEEIREFSTGFWLYALPENAVNGIHGIEGVVFNFLSTAAIKS